MNKIFKTFCLAVAAVAMASCGDSAAYKNSVEYLPFKAEEGDQWGLIGTDGKVLFEDEFAECPSPVYNGRFKVKNGDGLYELYTAETKPKKVGKEYKKVGTFFEDVTPAVEPNKHIDFIDKDGNVKFTFDKVNGKEVEYVQNFIDGIAVFHLEKGGTGCINTSGKVVVEPTWVSIGNIGDGKMLAISKKDYNEENSEKSKISVIDYNGKVLSVISPDKMKICSAFSDGYAAAFKSVDGEAVCGIINDKCEWVVKPSEKYDEGITQIKDGMFVYQHDGKYGVSTIKDGEVVVRPKYNSAVIVDSRHLIVETADGELQLMTVEGEELTKDKYMGLAGSFDGNYIAQDGDHSFLFLNSEGEPIDKKQSLYAVNGVRSVLKAMYTPNELSSDEAVFNDYVDIAGIVNELQITANGMNGLTLNSTPKDVVTKERGRSSDEESLAYLSRGNTIDGTVTLKEYPCNITVEYGYGKIVDKVGYTYTLSSTSKAKSIKAEFASCDKITDKQKEVYQAICAALEKAGWTVWDDEKQNAKGYKNGNLFAIAYYNVNAGLVISGEDRSIVYEEINDEFLSDI